MRYTIHITEIQETEEQDKGAGAEFKIQDISETGSGLRIARYRNHNTGYRIRIRDKIYTRYSIGYKIQNKINGKGTVKTSNTKIRKNFAN